MVGLSDDIRIKFELLKADFQEFRQEFGDFMSKTEGRFDKLYNLVDGLAGDFKKIDEETVLPHYQSGHTDRLEKLETKVFGNFVK